MASRSGSWRASARFSGFRRDGLPQVLERFVDSPSHAERHRHDVVRVVAVRVIAAARAAGDRARRVIAGVQRDGRGIDALRGVLGPAAGARGFALADPQIEARALQQLALLGVALDDGPEEPGGGLEVVPLERLDAALVDRDGFVEARLAGRRGAGRRRAPSTGCRLSAGARLRLGRMAEAAFAGAAFPSGFRSA